MEPSGTGAAGPAAAPADVARELSASARGWHAIQVAVLGFIGFCGVLRTADSPAPRAVQWLAAALAVAALVVACLAILTVGRIAYPVGGAVDGASALPSAKRTAARLRAGIWLTIAAVVLAVIAALPGWWPAPASSSAAVVTSTSGQSWCGPLVSGPAGTVGVRTGNGVSLVPVQAIAQVRPVAQCP